MMHKNSIKRAYTAIIQAIAALSSGHAADGPGGDWSIGAPVVTYWAGPGFPGGGVLTETAAAQMAQGGWNLVWCTEQELDVVQSSGLRGLITSELLSPAILDDPAKREALDAFILRVQKHPGFYAYHLTDEPGAGQCLGRDTVGVARWPASPPRR